MMERTLVLLKPDAVQRGLSGRIVTRFEDAGFKIRRENFGQEGEHIKLHEMILA